MCDIDKKPVEQHPGLITPFKHEILLPTDPGDIVPTPKYNYTPYNLFVFKTKMRYLIQKRWGRDVDIILSSVEYRNYMHIRVTPIRGKDEMTISYQDEIVVKNMITEILKEPLIYALAVSYNDIEFKNDIIPGFWVKLILPYLKVTSSELNINFDYKVGRYGLEVNYRNSGPSKRGDKRKYIDFQSLAIDRVYDLYTKGYVLNPSPDTIKKWKLKRGPKGGDWYYPDWNNLRITKPYGNMAQFIWSRLMGETSSKIQVGYNLAEYHMIAKNIPKAHFGGGYLYLNDSSLNSTLKAIKIINNLPDVHMTAIGFDIESYHVKQFTETAESLGYDSVAYTKDSIRGHNTIFSIEIDPEYASLTYSIVRNLKNEVNRRYKLK